MEWFPQPKQELFLRSSVSELLYGGTKGPGKTDALLFDATYQINKPYYKAIIFRRNYPKLQDIIDRSHRWFRGKAIWNGELRRWTWPSMAFLEFGHCKNEQDKYNYQGKEYHYEGFDQLEEFTETQYLFLTAQCRTTNPDITPFIRATANPGQIGHAWVKARFIDKLTKDGKPKYFKRVNDEDIETTKDDPDALSRGYIFATIYDNPILLKNDPSYLARLKALPEKDRRALLEGDWDIFVGQFFEMWRRNIHVIPYSRFTEMLKELPFTKFMALDYGYTKPASVGWYCVLPEGKIIRYRELYIEGYTYFDLAHLILAANEKANERDIKYLVADPAIWGDKQHHEKHLAAKEGEAKGKSGYQVMQEVIGDRFPIIKGDNRRNVGWVRFREALKPYFNQFKELTARFLVTDNCKHFIRTLPGCIHDELNPEDLDTAGEDHPADEGRYAIMSRPEIPVLPQPEPSTAVKFWDTVKKDIDRHKPFAEEQIHEVLEEGARRV